jgi:hypothetical protein
MIQPQLLKQIKSFKVLAEAIENYEKQAAKAEAAGQTAKAMLAREAAAARKVWLEEAKKGLTDFSS